MLDSFAPSQPVSPHRLTARRRLGRHTFALIISALLIAGSGCVYRQDVQQGNEITRDMVELIEPGMTKREVVKSLGLPLINDPFNRDRWDYFYSLKKGRDKQADKQSVTLRFNEDILQAIQINIPEAES